jgi:hypothetical protein
MAAVSLANSDGAVQCMGAGENEKLERQEGQTDSAGKERGNAVGTVQHASVRHVATHATHTPF